MIFHKRLAMDVVDYEKIASLASNAGRNMMIPTRLTCGNNNITCPTAAILDLEISKMATKQRYTSEYVLIEFDDIKNVS